MNRQIISAFILFLILNTSLGSLSVFAQSVSDKEENSIRLMSYNIRNAKGLDNITDYDRNIGYRYKCGRCGKKSKRKRPSDFARNRFWKRKTNDYVKYCKCSSK